MGNYRCGEIVETHRGVMKVCLINGTGAECTEINGARQASGALSRSRVCPLNMHGELSTAKQWYFVSGFVRKAGQTWCKALQALQALRSRNGRSRFRPLCSAHMKYMKYVKYGLTALTAWSCDDSLFGTFVGNNGLLFARRLFPFERVYIPFNSQVGAVYSRACLP